MAITVPQTWFFSITNVLKTLLRRGICYTCKLIPVYFFRNICSRLVKTCAHVACRYLLTSRTLWDKFPSLLYVQCGTVICGTPKLH
uniref:Putative secreted protein n=1 Tax=Amblyomma cajennense TaxID=34607 RepID=A0A023FDJ1_AMBCJ